MISSGKPSYTIDDIRTVTTDADIASQYLNVNRIPVKINSPFRVDERPSLGLYSPDGIKVYYKDFGTGERGDIYHLLGRIWNISLQEVYNKVYLNIKKNSHTPIKRKTTYKSPIIKTKSELRIKVREWKKHDIEYWESYGITLDWLKYANVYPISHKIVYKGNDKMIFGADKYAYAYIERKEGKVTMKIYQPFNKNGFKWASKHDRSVISLWTKVPQKGKVICICSSLKDALCLWANTGIPALATQGEGYPISDTAVKSLKSRYENIYILYDNDEAGLIDGEKLAEETGFTNLVLPKINEAKDVSDLYKSLKDKKQFKQIILNIFKNGSS